MKDYPTLRTSFVEFRDLRLSPTGTTESRAEGVLTVLSPLSVQINDLSFFANYLCQTRSSKCKTVWEEWKHGYLMQVILD